VAQTSATNAHERPLLLTPSPKKHQQISTIRDDCRHPPPPPARLGKPTLYQLSYVRAEGDSRGRAGGLLEAEQIATKHFSSQPAGTSGTFTRAVRDAAGPAQGQDRRRPSTGMISAPGDVVTFAFRGEAGQVVAPPYTESGFGNSTITTEVLKVDGHGEAGGTGALHLTSR
jgi:hypothetical protein